MLYEDATTRLRSIVEWLEGTDNADWEDQSDSASDCLKAFKHMARPIYSTDITGGDDAGLPIDDPAYGQLNTAIPYAERMLIAMSNKNRVDALNNAKAALTALYNDPYKDERPPEAR